MAYFSNGTEGMDWQERNCMRCLHWSNELGCPVWNSHLLYAYGAKGKVKDVLDMLIPMEGAPGLPYKTAGECAMLAARAVTR